MRNIPDLHHLTICKHGLHVFLHFRRSLHSGLLPKTAAVSRSSLHSISILPHLYTQKSTVMPMLSPIIVGKLAELRLLRLTWHVIHGFLHSQ